MHIRTLAIALFVGLSLPALAQEKENRFALGVNAMYEGNGNVGLGLALDHQHRLGRHTEVLVGVSFLHSFHAGSAEQGVTYISTTRTFLGAGMGYRGAGDHRGLHAGLLLGGLFDPVKNNYGGEDLVRFVPAFDLNIGHSLGARCDLSLDLVVGSEHDGSKAGFTTVKFNYQLFPRK